MFCPENMNMTDRLGRHENAEHENTEYENTEHQTAGHENAGRDKNCKMKDMTMRDVKMQDMKPQNVKIQYVAYSNSILNLNEIGQSASEFHRNLGAVYHLGFDWKLIFTILWLVGTHIALAC